MSSSRTDLIVVLDAPELGPSRPVGVLTRWPGPILSVAFAYARSWLNDLEGRFAIDPLLPVTDAQLMIPGRRLPGIFRDTAPDRWGEALLVRRAGGRSLDAWDFLVGVADASRMGALRLQTERDGPFIAHREPAVPPRKHLREVQDLARAFEDDPSAISDDDFTTLVAPGSSLGGARPKANFIGSDGSLWIAKFPSKTDRRDAAAWESVYSALARRAGIEVPDSDLLRVGGSGRTFVTRRFDRTATGRRLYASAMTLTGRAEPGTYDYIDIAEAIATHGAPEHVRGDLRQLYRRMAFNVLAGNRDDHLQNHGFLRSATGWRLAPAFDLNPAREMREHATAVNGVRTAPTAADVLAVHSYFGLSTSEAAQAIGEVASAVSTWRELATSAAIATAEQTEVAPAFAALETAAHS